MVAFWLKRFLKIFAIGSLVVAWLKWLSSCCFFITKSLIDLCSDTDFKGILGQSLPATYICIPISVHALGLCGGLKAVMVFD